MWHRNALDSWHAMKWRAGSKEMTGNMKNERFDVRYLMATSPESHSMA